MPSDIAKLNKGIMAADLDQAWKDRLEDAQALDTAGRFGAAMALRLYALEIYLKYRICQRLNLNNPLKKLEIHDLDALLVFAGLSQALVGMEPDSKIRENWNQVISFSDNLNDLRYFPAGRWSQHQSVNLNRWLNHDQDGVMTWLKKQT